MNIIGNIIWIVFGGLALALEYLVSGFLLCCTIIGIPFGIQVFKIGILELLTFGHGCLYFIMNVIWLFIGGIWIALTHLGLGLLFCITIVGIPFGIQHFKLMSVALTPFGREIISAR